MSRYNANVEIEIEADSEAEAYEIADELVETIKDIPSVEDSFVVNVERTGR